MKYPSVNSRVIIAGKSNAERRFDHTPSLSGIVDWSCFTAAL